MSKHARSRYGQISVAEQVYIISSLVSALLPLLFTLAGTSLVTAQGICNGSIISTDGSFGDNQLGNMICC
jgi:hypothetical protein